MFGALSKRRDLRSLPCLGDGLEVGLQCQYNDKSLTIDWTYLVVILLTRLLVIGLDLGELDLHVVVAGGQPVSTHMLGKAYSGRGN